MPKKPKPQRVQPGTERARDEQRDDGGPRYAGKPWKVADERGDRRFGHARIDDADRSELEPGTHAVDDDEWPGSDATGEAHDVNAEDSGSAESGGQRAGFGRGEKPRKPRARSKKNPRSGSKRKTDRR